MASDIGFWSITKLDDADFVLRDHTAFTSQRGTLLNLLGKDDPAGGKQMAATDPPRHTRMREPLQRVLAKKNVERYAGRIQEQVKKILAPGATGEPFDFAQAMIKLPMAVTGTMMALPEEDWDRLASLTMAAVCPDDNDYVGPGGPEATLQTAHRELFSYFQDMVSARRKNTGEDLISTLLTMEVEGENLTLGEVLSNCYSLLLGANVTTPFPPIAAMEQMLASPELAQKWSANPRFISTGTEEALRWASPANHFMRYAVRDVEMRGKSIRSGDAVVVWLGSVNRDEDVFQRSFEFDITRRPNRHVAFGIGPHYCIGHTVARLSLRILFTELLGTFCDFEQLEPGQHLASNFVAGIKRLPMKMSVRPDAAGRSE
ncbi:cytochrome P450 [Actinomadura formosensis]|uniref:cytochrome P450 n=1 Tax=Actinomadura formosensis TaxID=60706 RepID=UPI003D8D3854